MRQTGIPGGKGATSRPTPGEIIEAGKKHSLHRDAEELVALSRFTAKIDNNAV